MKNLKRVLSLGLASVMLLGMMVVGASAKDFTDAEDIIHDEAVEVMVALSIINGKEDGSYFAPKDNVTRGEMAKMIAVMMNGGSEANTGIKGTPTFTDIGGHWAEGWIEYCADMKIINGRGDGTFDPNGLVTGTEALKMVLTAMGYDAEAYHLQGAAWASQTLERARQTNPVKLTEELDDVVMTAPATRDTAAQMIWNGLQAYVVTNKPSQNTSNGEVTWGWSEGTTKLLEQRYNAHIHTGTFNGDYNTGNAGLKGEIDVAGIDIPYDFPIDQIGEEVKVVWKNGARSTSTGLDNKDVIYGVFNTGATRVLRTQMSKVNEYKDGKALIKIDGTTYDCLPTVDVITNFDTDAAASKSSVNASGNSALTTFLRYNSGNPIKFTFDEDGKIEKAYVTESYVAAVTAINSENITMSGVGTLKIADHDIEDGLEKGDIVIVTPLYSTDYSSSDCVATVKKAESITGEVTAYKENESVTVDGKVYKLNYKNPKNKFGLLQNHPDAEINANIIKDFNDGSQNNNTYIGEDVELYLSNGYVMAAVQTSKSANNYSVVLEVKNSNATSSVFNNLQLQVMGADGTKEIITVSDDSKQLDGTTAAVNSNDYQVGDIVTYSFNDDDEADVRIRAKASSQTVAYSSKTKTVNGIVAAADCVFFAQTKTGKEPETDKRIINNAVYEAYDIRDLDTKSWTEWASIATDKNGKVVAVFVNIKNIPDGAADNIVYGVISGYNGRIKDYYNYTVQANGEEYTVNAKDYLGKDKGVLVSFRPTADDKYGNDKVDKITTSTANYVEGYVKEFSSRDNTLTYSATTVWDSTTDAYKCNSDTTTYALADNAKILYVDQDNQKSLAEATVDGFNTVNNKANVAIITKVVEGVTVIDVMIVETSGKQHVNYRLGAHK